MGDDFAFAGVVLTVAGAEEAAFDGYEGVVEGGLECAVPVAIDDGYGVWDGDGDMVGSEADEGA